VDPAAPKEAEGSIAQEVSEEEVVLEEVGEVPRASRRLHLKGTAGVEVSSPSKGIGALAQRSAVK
jgi:hypothetical protein